MNTDDGSSMQACSELVHTSMRCSVNGVCHCAIAVVASPVQGAGSQSTAANTFRKQRIVEGTSNWSFRMLFMSTAIAAVHLLAWDWNEAQSPCSATQDQNSHTKSEIPTLAQ